MTQNLTFCCPYCHHQYDDELELLNTGDLHDFRCENCSNPFQALIEECLSCNVETVFVWKLPQSAVVISQLSCEACGKQFNSLDSTVEQPTPPSH